MRRYIQRAGQVLLIALAWFVSGYVSAGAISVAFLEGPFFSRLAYQGALVNVFVSAVITAIMTATPRGRRAFYEGPETGNSGKLLIWAVIILPVPCAVIGIGWLILDYLARLLGLWKI